MLKLPFEQILNSLRGCVIITDTDGIDNEESPIIIFVNDFFCELMGYTKEEIVGQPLHFLNGPDTDKSILKKVNQAFKNKTAIDTELLHYTKMGNPRWLSIAITPIEDKETKRQYFAIIEHDISAHKTFEHQAEQQAFIDPLTHLYNRTFFFKRAPEIMSAMQRYQAPFGLLIMDIDQFKALNDKQGYNHGDKALCDVAKACLIIFRKSDLICRYGGDKFAIIVERNESKDSLTKKAKQLNNQIKQVTHNDITVSIGGTVSKLYEDSMEQVLKRAEKALYDIKSKPSKTAFYIN